MVAQEATNPTPFCAGWVKTFMSKVSPPHEFWEEDDSTMGTYTAWGELCYIRISGGREGGAYFFATLRFVFGCCRNSLFDFGGKKSSLSPCWSQEI